MLIGDSSYISELIRIAIGSNGAVSFEYLENSGCSIVRQINDVIKQVSSEVYSGK